MFLFAAHPELAPMLASFNPKNPCSSRGILVESWSYQLPYMYRTSVFSALLAGDAAGAEERIALMREHVGYYYHGEPDGFINDTAKMAESYIRRQNSMISLPTVFASVSRCPYPRKSISRCALSGLPISHGDPVYRVKYKTWNDASIYDVLVDKAQENPDFMRSVEYFERRMYPCSLMFYDDLDNMKLFDPEWARDEAIIREHERMRSIVEAKPEDRASLMMRYCLFDLAEIKAKLRRKIPAGRPPLSAEQILEKFLDGLEKIRCGQKVTLEDTDWLWKALGTLVMSEVHLLLAERHAELPDELRVALACSDNHVFVRLAAAGGLLPDWEQIHGLVGKARLTLDDMLALAEWGRNNPGGLKLLWKTHKISGLLGVSAGYFLAPRGFGEMLDNGRGGQLLFLFAAHPELAPMLASFNPKDPYSSRGMLVESWSYQLPYAYRSGVFSALLAGDAAGAEAWVALMREHVGYYYHGKPDGFINDTAKMADKYIRKYLR